MKNKIKEVTPLYIVGGVGLYAPVIRKGNRATKPRYGNKSMT
jgi:hypothetical protein